MAYAARLGHRALGTTAENPPVGCVIVKEDRVLGVGWTQAGGRPHAETEALRMAGAAAHGATAYVTLEPCAHHGRTPPCAGALVAAGIVRVVTALDDPDPRVSGSGHAILRRAGIVVETGIGADLARRDLEGFLTRIVRHRPYVILKLAVSADDKIAAGRGQRTAITGEEVKRRVHLLRAQCDGVLIGLSTALADDPELTCRLPGLEHRSPVRIVADSRLSIPPRLRLVQTARQVPLWLLATRRDWIGDDITVIDCLATKEGWVDFGHALGQLAARGLNRLLVEGGSFVARSLLDLGLVDEVRLFRSPRKIGPQGIEAIAETTLDQALAGFELTHEETLGDDRLSVYEYRKQSSSGVADAARSASGVS
jgi:diaminohydroxyphosphoribosylaminopyrimidine deaminase/5-amino-6-(5-phosphoribosylamino)uracil reductase